MTRVIETYVRSLVNLKMIYRELSLPNLFDFVGKDTSNIVAKPVFPYKTS